MRRSVLSASRQFALRMEEMLKRGLHSGHRRWTATRHGHSAFCPGDFRGGCCHCPNGAQPHFVHSEGLREACDFVIDFGTNVRSLHRPAVHPSLLASAVAELLPGSIVHIKTELIDVFVRDLLGHLRRPIVLVTGESDAGLVAKHRALLDDPRMIHWFAQNCDIPDRHPRLTRIPIGLDNPVYTTLEKRLGFALTMLLRRTPFDASFSRNDIGDQLELQRVRSLLPAPASRPLRALCTFHQNQKIVSADVSNIPERAQAREALAANPCCDFIPRRLRQRDCWARHGAYAFEVSPRGNGLDCFRTLEALLLGTIPIVRRSTLTPLFEDESLPVAVVDSWAEVTPERLARWREELQPRFGDALEEKLSLAYWVAKIKKASQSASPL